MTGGKNPLSTMWRGGQGVRPAPAPQFPLVSIVIRRGRCARAFGSVSCKMPCSSVAFTSPPSTSPGSRQANVRGELPLQIAVAEDGDGDA